jgi:hypothetical protein
VSRFARSEIYDAVGGLVWSAKHQRISSLYQPSGGISVE